MGFDLGHFCRNLLDLCIHHSVLLFDEIKSLILIKLDEKITAHFYNDPVQVKCLCLHVEFMADVESHVQFFELLLSRQLDRTFQLVILAKLFV